MKKIMNDTVHRETAAHVNAVEFTLENIVRMTQSELKQAVKRELEARAYRPISKKGFLYAEGELPVLLVAHLDTVHKTPVRDILYSKDGRLIMSPEGIGGDDRCGVHMIMEILHQARCHVLFTEDEETGCQGARAFANSKIRPSINYIVELDRRGSNDAVFYQCVNPEFTDFICSFGFVEARGSFSDISVIAPRLGVAAVNISAGYYNEHSRHEYINLLEVECNITRVSEMVQSQTEQYDYIERSYSHSFGQMSFEDASLWDFSDFSQGKNRSKWLMPLPDTARLALGGYETAEIDAHLIDSSGEVYRYLPELDAAIHSENAQAHSRTGEPLVYDRKQARRLQVLPLETAFELLGP